VADPIAFGNLLTDALYRISRCEANKPISVIQDELGHSLGRSGATALVYWRQGHIPKTTDIQQLAKAIVQRSDLDRPWVQNFLAQADYPYPEKLCDDLFPNSSTLIQPSAFASLSLQTKPYQTLVGRHVYLDELLAILADPTARPLVAIDGMGGIGKTALAYEIADRCLKQQLFDQVVWFSTGKDQVSNGEVVTFSNILTTLAQTVGTPDVAQLPDAQKIIRLRALLQRWRILLVLDNVENAAEPPAVLVEKLRPLLGKSKALLTSRLRFTGDGYVLHLDGLTISDAHEFLRQEGAARGIHTLRNAAHEELTEVAVKTGGSPLAMKLVVGQLSYLPLLPVLTHLQMLQPLHTDHKADDYRNFYRFLYLPTWNLLTETSKELLVMMTHFAPGIGGVLEAIASVSESPAEQVHQPISELWRFSFLEVGKRIGLQQTYYYLHPLTHYFVLSDIVNEVGEHA
jgi:hypothetical protein